VSDERRGSGRRTSICIGDDALLLNMVLLSWNDGGGDATDSSLHLPDTVVVVVVVDFHDQQQRNTIRRKGGRVILLLLLMLSLVMILLLLMIDISSSFSLMLCHTPISSVWVGDSPSLQ